MNKKTDLNLSFKKHFKPRSENELGYFLAGLVDADGYFTKTGGLSLSFHSHDLSVALTLKHKLGGNLYFYKKQHALSLTWQKKTVNTKFTACWSTSFSLSIKLNILTLALLQN